MFQFAGPLMQEQGSDVAITTSGISSRTTERSLIQQGTALTDLRPNLLRVEKKMALTALKDLLSNPTFQMECAEICKAAGSQFRTKDLAGELAKAGSIFEHYILQLDTGLHDYSRLKGDTIEVRQPYGRIVGFTAPNYPIGENAAVMGVLNAILAGCPIDLRMGAGSSKEIDLFMADKVIEALKNIVPEGFIGKVDIGHSNSREVLGQYAGIFFIGGSTGLQLLEYTQHKIGNLQTGRPNWMLVQDGAEADAAKMLSSVIGSRFGLSCSATSVVFIEGSADELIAFLQVESQNIKLRLEGEGESTTPDSRFRKSLLEARDICVRAGGTDCSGLEGYSTLIRMDATDFSVMKEAGNVPEVFGPGFLIVENARLPKNPSAENPGSLALIAPAKTGIIVAQDQTLGELLATSTVNLAARISFNLGSSTPAPGVGYQHRNVDGHPAEQRHIVHPTAFLRPVAVIRGFSPEVEEIRFWD